ncbi:MAG TPA: hypothetical protein VFB02_24165 [Bradyrhizobium sp.]|nr:hypothetical protein [Bradyrhizobium sp.]
MPDYPLPSFLAPRAAEHEYDEYGYDEYEQPSTFERELRDTSGLIRASIITVAVAVSGIVLAVTLGHPVRVLADATASLSDKQGSLGTRSAADAPPVQSSADARSSAPAAGAALTHEQLAALAELSNQARPGNNETSSGALLEQFQAWAARQDAQRQEQAEADESVRPAEAAPVQIARDQPTPEEPAQRHGTTSSLRNARAEMPHVQKPRTKSQHKQAARRQAAPIQDALALQQPLQNAEQPSFMQSFGWKQ